MNNKMNRAVIFVSYKIGSKCMKHELDFLRQWCRYNNLEVVAIINEETETGTIDRKGFGSCYSMIEQGFADGIVTLSSSMIIFSNTEMDFLQAVSSVGGFVRCVIDEIEEEEILEEKKCHKDYCYIMLV